jgi:HEAT repeat protein/beta-lactamase regulating signal transducer with metallopeptidase domain
MNEMLQQINSIGKAFVQFAGPMLIQSGALVLILLLADLLLRKKVRAVFRYWMWMLVLVKLLLPTSLSLPMSFGYWFGDKLGFVEKGPLDFRYSIPDSGLPFEHRASSIEHALPSQPTPDSERTPAEPVNPPKVSVRVPAEWGPTALSWQGALFLVWLAVVIVMCLLLLQRAIFVRGLIAQAEESTGSLIDALQYCCQQIAVKRKVSLKISPNASSPAVCGLFRPVILMPQKLASNLGSDRLQVVLMHELAHVKRRDLWVNLAQTILQIVYFYNPLLWLANAIIRRVREQAVDEAVLVAMGDAAQQYPQTLLDVAKLAFRRPTLSLRLIGVVESKSALASRIKHILNRPIPKSAKLGVLGLLVVILAAVILLPMAGEKVEIGQGPLREMTLVLGWNGQQVRIPAPVVFPEWGRKTKEFKRWHRTKDMRTFTTYDVDGYKYVARAHGFVKLRNGQLKEDIPFVQRFRPDGELEADSTYINGEPADWRLYDKQGQKKVYVANYPGGEDRKRGVVFYGPGGAEIKKWQVSEFDVVYAEMVTDPNGRSYFTHYLKELIHSPYAKTFSATLPNGVTVELVGLCKEPVDGAKWWKPDGSDMPEPFFRANKRTAPLKGTTTEYTFLAKAEGSEDISIKMKIYEGFGWSTQVAEDGTALCYIKHRNDAKPYHKDAFSQGPIEVGVAQGQWIKGRGVSSPNIQIPRSYLIGNHDQIIIQAPRPEKNSPETATIFWFTSSSHDCEYRLICTLKNGSVEECMKPFFESTNIIETGNLKNSTLNTKSFNIDRPLEQIVNYELLYRKFDYACFNNVAFKPNAKTDVQIEVEKAAVQAEGESEAPIGQENKEHEELQDPNEPSYAGRSLTELIAALGNQDFQTRINAVYHLGYIGPKAKPAVPALVDALEHEQLRESILHSLGNIGVGAEQAIPALIKAVAEYAPACRWMAAESLAKIGKAAIPALKEAAASENTYLRIWSNAALARQEGTDSPNLRYLAQLMKNNDKDTASEAVSALTMLGPISKPLVPDLIEALGHSVVAKRHIAFALAQIGKDARPAVPELTKMLHDTDLETQADAIYALSEIGGPDIAPAVPLLIEALRTDDTSNAVMASRVRYTAATALGNIGPDARAAIPDLVVALGDEEEFLRANSAEAIGNIDPADLQAVPALIKAMKDKSGRVRVAAAETLLRIGPVNKEVILAFIEAADDNWKGVIIATETFFTYLGPQHSYVIPDLIEMLKGPNERAQRLAITALGNMSEAAVPAVPYIVESVKNSRLEATAAGALTKLGSGAGAAVPDLIEMLKDRHKKSSAALVLEAIGPAAREAIPALENCLGGDQVQYARALLAINPKSSKAIDALVKIAESAYVPDQWSEQPDAHYLLVKYGHNQKRHLRGLTDALENPNSRIRLNAAAYLGNLGSEAKEAAESLVRALKDEDPEVIAEAARAILLTSSNRSEREEACNIIIGLLGSKDSSDDRDSFMAQLRAGSALASFGPSEEWAVPLLITKVQDGNMRTRAAAIKALGNIGPGAKEALPYLRQLLKNEDWQVRLSATQAIEKIDSRPAVHIGGEEVRGESVIGAVNNKATLASGATVELLGLTPIPVTEDMWWRADGSALPQAPFDDISFTPKRGPKLAAICSVCDSHTDKGKATPGGRAAKVGLHRCSVCRYYQCLR